MKVSKRAIYLDNAASTPIERRVKKEMDQATELYANPSSFNDAGRTARGKLETSRSAVARFLGARSEEVIFTSSGSEANNMAIFGLTGVYPKRGEIITTPIEHSSVLEPLKVLQKEGWKITHLKINSEGLIDSNDLEKKLNPEVVLVSIIYANNEIGTIQPIKTISKIINNFRKSLGFRIFSSKVPVRSLESLSDLGFDGKTPFFHIDACQAAGFLDMNVNNLDVDLMTFNGTKTYGPRGIGVLYVKRGTPFQPLIYGGDQEYGLRAGTENLPAIAGLAKAISLIDRKDGRRLAELRDYFFEKIVELIPDVKINGPLGSGRLPNNINISIPSLDPVRSSRAAVQRTRAFGTSATSNGVDSENLLLELDKYGIYASSGSACTARSVEPSHVLKAIGVEKKYLNGALRLSLGRQTTKKDTDCVLKVLPKVVENLKERYRK